MAAHGRVGTPDATADGEETQQRLQVPAPPRRLSIVREQLQRISWNGLGYGLGFDSYAFRVGWSNFGLALSMLLVCLACAWPAPHAAVTKARKARRYRR